MIIEIISHKGSTRMHERFYHCTVPERANFTLPDSFKYCKCFPFEKFYSLDVFVFKFSYYLWLRKMSFKL